MHISLLHFCLIRRTSQHIVMLGIRQLLYSKPLHVAVVVLDYTYQCNLSATETNADISENVRAALDRQLGSDQL